MPSPRPQFIENAKAKKTRLISEAQVKKQQDIAAANAKKEQARNLALQEKQARIAAAQRDADAKKAAADAKMSEARAGQQQLNTRKSLYEQQLGTHFDSAMQQYGNAKLQSATGARLSTHVVSAVPDTIYQQVWQKLVDRGYRLISFHGFEFKGKTFFNVIFQKNPGLTWASYHNLNAQQYQDLFNKFASQGHHLAYINSYVSRGQICYAPIFVKENRSNWVAYHGLTTDAHQNRFNELVRQGHRIVNQSIVSYNGTNYFTVLYDKQNVGGWTAFGLLSADQYQQQFDSNVQQARSLAFLDTISINGQPSFSAIWDSTQYKGWVARHNMDTNAFHSEFMSCVGKGWKTKILCAYQNGDKMNYAAMWHA